MKKKKVDLSKTLRGIQKHFAQVREVRDADTNVVIHVTPKDIAWAARKNHNACALARACERTVDAALITRSTAYLVRDGVATRYLLSPGARTEIISFDRGAAFMPGSYALNAPGPSQRFGVKRGAPLGRKTGDKPRHTWTLTKGLRTALNGKH